MLQSTADSHSNFILYTYHEDKARTNCGIATSLQLISQLGIPVFSKLSSMVLAFKLYLSLCLNCLTVLPNKVNYRTTPTFSWFKG